MKHTHHVHLYISFFVSTLYSRDFDFVTVLPEIDKSVVSNKKPLLSNVRRNVYKALMTMA